MREPKLFVITGIMASGKSTVAQLLAERFERSVHLRGDVFRRMIVNDRREVHPDAAEEELDQLRLRYRLAVQAADTYGEEGYTVVLQDVIVGRVLNDFVALIQNRPFYLVVLCPDAQTVAEREAGRHKKGYGLWSVAQLDHVLRHETPAIGMWLDTSRLTPEETVDAILKRAEGEALIRND
ncbi:phosphotransferase [Paenibacillus nanensis]|uniref:Phosphotransferase n=1 Tax=Paenibacillus nanensis TaxID=393251 RepID=A0A3A1VIP5_9BACL|nr:AAA family ATPase [Paenibacillus nanensis]RIX60331.1 phosphotransferase [Paenibacillus nanensis]